MTEEEYEQYQLQVEELKRLLYSTDNLGPEEENPFGIFY
jgi:hypothetical protein